MRYRSRRIARSKLKSRNKEQDENSSSVTEDLHGSSDEEQDNNQNDESGSDNDSENGEQNSETEYSSDEDGFLEFFHSSLFDVQTLPSDCWSHILSYLSPIPEIISFSEVCKSFNKMARNPQLWRSVTLDGADWTNFFNTFTSAGELNELTLRRMGSIKPEKLSLLVNYKNMKYFHIDSQKLHLSFLLPILNAWSEHLQVLKITNCSFDNKQLPKNFHIEESLPRSFPALQVLVLEESTVPSGFALHFIRHAPQLQEIYADGNEDPNLLLNIEIPSLKKLCFFRNYNTSSEVIEEFLARTPNLEKIQLCIRPVVTGYQGFASLCKLSDLHLQTIGNRYTPTSQLTVPVFKESFPSLTRLKLSMINITNFGIQHCFNLTSLTLHASRDLSELETILPCLPNIQQLHVTEPILAPSASVAHVISQLPELTDLHFENLFTNDNLNVLQNMKLTRLKIDRGSFSMHHFFSAFNGNIATTLEILELKQVKINGTLSAYQVNFPNLKSVTMIDVKESGFEFFGEFFAECQVRTARVEVSSEIQETLNISDYMSLFGDVSICVSWLIFSQSLKEFMFIGKAKRKDVQEAKKQFPRCHISVEEPEQEVAKY